MIYRVNILDESGRLVYHLMLNAKDEQNAIQQAKKDGIPIAVAKVIGINAGPIPYNWSVLIDKN